FVAVELALRPPPVVAKNSPAVAHSSFLRKNSRPSEVAPQQPGNPRIWYHFSAAVIALPGMTQSPPQVRAVLTSTSTGTGSISGRLAPFPRQNPRLEPPEGRPLPGGALGALGEPAARGLPPPASSRASLTCLGEFQFHRPPPGLGGAAASNSARVRSASAA